MQIPVGRYGGLPFLCGCMFKSILFIVGFLFTTLGLRAQPNFDFNPNCVQAYQDAICLRLNAAQRATAAEKMRNPNNLVPHFIDNYIDFFTLFLNEDPAELKVRAPFKERRLALMASGPTGSPFTLFTQAIIKLQWAAIDVKFGNRWSSGWAFRDAFKLAKQNQTLFPAFMPNYMITGPLQMAASTIPKNYKWLSNMMGIKGTMQEGQRMLNQFLNSRDPWAQLFMNEGTFYQCYTQFYLLNQPNEALDFIKTRHLDIVNNHLFTYMTANLYLNNKQSQLTEAVVQGRNKSPEYMSTPLWDFELGFAKLYRQAPDTHEHLERFLATFKGKFYVKEVNLKLAWFYLLQGNQGLYNRYIAKVISTGAAESDADKRALKDAKSGKQPNTLLLRARLLNDGGYHAQALNLLAGKSNTDFADDGERLEFTYRVARIYDDLNRDDEAIKAYLATIGIGKNRTDYYAARAALQIAMIYEKRGNLQKAIEFYKICIGMEGHDYEDSLEQKSKAGIARCGG
jgi:tetratricopeptide (TPR) repeat protein